jgi:N-acetylglucosaminyldiphosphoundecaprenol N-acetyl-beta-D-mannosaminyltransferase
MISTTTRHLSLCGIPIDAMRREDMIALVDEAVHADEKVVLFHHNLHSLYLYETNVALRQAYSVATSAYIDGMIVVWIARLAGLRLDGNHRITLLDSFDFVIETAAKKGWRVFYLGSAESVFKEGISRLHTRHPELTIAGHHGFFDKSDQGSRDVIEQINAFRPDVLFVGLGMPIQEFWLAENHTELKASAIITSGATLDYVAGAVYKPPSWAGPLGLYGVMRLCADPKRLWRRYLVEPIILLAHLLPRLLRQRFGRSAAQTG